MSEYVGYCDDLINQPSLWFKVQPRHRYHPQLQLHGVAEGIVLCDGHRYQWLDTGFGYTPSLTFHSLESKRCADG